MRILMLGNSFTTANHMPSTLARLSGAHVVCHARGGARLAEQLNPKTKLGASTLASLTNEHWDYVVLQEMSHGPLTSPKSFFSSVQRLCEQIRECSAIPVLYATWAYRKGSARLEARGWDYQEMAANLSQSYRKAACENGALLADVGQEFHRMSDSWDLYAADGVHPSGLGSLVAAQTIWAAIQKHREMRS